MDDAFAVRSVQPICRLDRIPNRVGHRKRPGDRPSLDVLHDEVVLADVIEGADMVMVQCGDGARFTLEPVAEPFVRFLDRNRAVEAGVPGLVDRAHTAFANRLDDFVRTEASTNIEAHKRAPAWARRSSLINAHGASPPPRLRRSSPKRLRREGGPHPCAAARLALLARRGRWRFRLAPISSMISYGP